MIIGCFFLEGMGMLEISGFRGLTFDTGKVGSQDDVITPPYDVISPEERASMAQRGAHNMVHLILPEERDGLTRYEAAADTMNRWIEEGALVQDDVPHFYLLRQTFKDFEGNTKTRCGFFGAASLPGPGERYILGHEQTFAKPVEDRLSLTAATRANLGPVFTLYPDPDGVLSGFLGQMNAREADATATTFDDVRQEFWRVPYDPAVTEFFRGKNLYIADGHHRFLTACLNRDQMRERDHPTAPQPYDYLLVGLVAFEDPGLRVYPPHRLSPAPEGFDATAFLQRLEEWFKVEAVESNLPERVEEAPGACAMGVAIHGHGDYLLTLRDIDRVALLGDDHGPSWRDLDVAVLHRGIIEGVLGIPTGTEFVYERSAGKAVEAAHGGKTGLAFLLRGARSEQVRACAEAGEAMPHKSTYFFPKLPTGAVIYRLA